MEKKPRFSLRGEVRARVSLLERDPEDNSWQPEMSAEGSRHFTAAELCLIDAINTMAQELKETQAGLAELKAKMASLDAAFPDGASWGR